jgi:hypothetical protein
MRLKTETFIQLKGGDRRKGNRSDLDIWHTNDSNYAPLEIMIYNSSLVDISKPNLRSNLEWDVNRIACMQSIGGRLPFKEEDERSRSQGIVLKRPCDYKVQKTMCSHCWTTQLYLFHAYVIITHTQSTPLCLLTSSYLNLKLNLKVQWTMCG